jgi:hypothetical protein
LVTKSPEPALDLRVCHTSSRCGVGIIGPPFCRLVNATGINEMANVVTISIDGSQLSTLPVDSCSEDQHTAEACTRNDDPISRRFLAALRSLS